MNKETNTGSTPTASIQEKNEENASGGSYRRGVNSRILERAETIGQAHNNSNPKEGRENKGKIIILSILIKALQIMFHVELKYRNRK